MKFEDELCSIITVKFSFLDKIRILFGRKVTVHVNIKTENVVGATETQSIASVEHFYKTNGNGAYHIEGE